MTEEQPKLTDLQRRFIDEYLQCFNQTAAARRAGYSAASARQSGSDNMRIPYIRQEIERRMEESKLGANQILAQLASIAEGSMEDFLTPSGRGYRLDLKKAEQAGKLHLVKKYKKGKNGTEIELIDPMRALELLGKALKIFADRIELTGKDGRPLEFEQRLQESLDKIYGSDT